VVSHRGQRLEHEAAGAAQERRDVLGQQVLDGRRQAGSGEGDRTLLAKGVLHHGAQLRDLVTGLAAVHLVEGQQHPSAVRRELVGQGVELGPEAARPAHRRQVELQAPYPAHRHSLDATTPGRSLAHQVGQRRHPVLGHPLEQPGRRRLGQDHPSPLARQRLGLVEHDRLADPPVAREQRRPPSRSGTVIEGVTDLPGDGVATGEDRGRGAERRTERTA